MTMAAVFVAQASGVSLTLGQQVGILAVRCSPRKGGSGLRKRLRHAGGDARRVSVIPIAGLTLLLGVDRFMSEARAITNLIGNAVATMVVAKWTGVGSSPRDADTQWRAAGGVEEVFVQLRIENQE